MDFEHHEEFLCPYCGQGNTLLLDLTGGSVQEFVVDCEVCCAPVSVRLKVRGAEILRMDVKKENE